MLFEEEEEIEVEDFEERGNSEDEKPDFFDMMAGRELRWSFSAPAIVDFRWSPAVFAATAEILSLEEYDDATDFRLEINVEEEDDTFRLAFNDIDDDAPRRLDTDFECDFNFSDVLALLSFLVTFSMLPERGADVSKRLVTAVFIATPSF